MSNFNQVPEGYEVAKFELENDNNMSYYVVQIIGNQDEMIWFAQCCGTEVRTWGIETNGLPAACLPVDNVNSNIYIDYSNVMSDGDTQF